MAQILVVARSAEGSAAVADLLRGSDHDVIAAAGFDAAIGVLADHSPDLLISQVHLGAFNGLHLVIRSHVDHPSMRTMILDAVYDAVIERDARREGAAYLVEPTAAAELLAQVARTLAEVSPERRWRRKQPAARLVAHVARRPARVVNLSYGGLRLELLRTCKVPSRFDVALPGFGVTVRARPVWTRRTPSGKIWCGVELSEENAGTVAKWRRLVDSVHDAA